jgi:4-amino-4-deoxy-L-arabinose transferase-like glycosyltransferase
MNFPFETRQPGPLPWLVVALCAVYLLTGIIGHDPWKSEDAIGLAVAHSFYAGDSLQDWLRPAIAGEPWPEAEPLYHWLAAATAGATQWLLPFHEGARLASALFGGIFLFLLAGAGRQLYGNDAGWGAPLLAIGTLGLLVPMHEAQPAAAILAATTGVYWGAALLAQRPLPGGLVMGISLGFSFLAGGLGAVLPPLTLLALPLLQRRWAAFAVAVIVATLIAAVWPLLLFLNDPAFLESWWAAELNSVAPRGGFSAGHAKFLGWVAWPVLFVAPWAIWRGRKHLTAPTLLPPLLGIFVAIVWFLAHEAKGATILALMPPLMLLAATGSASLRRGAANAWDWFGMMAITIAAALIWLGSSAMLTGWPPKIAYNATKLEPGFVAHFSLPGMLVALVATAAWILALARMPRSPWRVVSRWAAGVTVTWVLLASLWMPWIDYGKTYRPVVASLRQALPADAGCIGRLSLGAPQRAALEYFGGIHTRWGNKACHWLIVQGGPDEAALDGWTRVWEGHRPGDRGEWLRLYRRTGG